MFTPILNRLSPIDVATVPTDTPTPVDPPVGPGGPLDATTLVLRNQGSQMLGLGGSDSLSAVPTDTPTPVDPPVGPTGPLAGNTTGALDSNCLVFRNHGTQMSSLFGTNLFANGFPHGVDNDDLPPYDPFGPRSIPGNPSREPFQLSSLPYSANFNTPDDAAQYIGASLKDSVSLYVNPATQQDVAAAIRNACDAWQPGDNLAQMIHDASYSVLQNASINNDMGVFGQSNQTAASLADSIANTVSNDGTTPAQLAETLLAEQKSV